VISAARLRTWSLGGSVVLATGLACTNAQLYAPNYQPDIGSLTGLEGDLCTDDPASTAFPLKVSVVIDGGIPGGTDDRVSALQALVKQYSGANVSFDFVLMGETPQSMTNGFTSDPMAIQMAITAIGAQVSPLRDYQGAMLVASTDIESDAVGLPPGIAARTNYALDFVAQGPPDPALPDLWCGANQLTPGSSQCTTQFDANFCPNVMPPPADCELLIYTGLVTSLATYLQSNGVLDLIAHFYQLGSDSRTKTLLSSMSLAAEGNFTQQPAGQLNLLDSALIDPNAHFLLREFVVWNQNALLKNGAVKPDSDGDGLTDDEEGTLGTSPTNWDTDGDGVGDKIEYSLASKCSEFNPKVSGTFSQCATLTLPFPDADDDGLNDCEEAIEATSPYLQDTDEDGLPDVVEVLRGLFPLVDDRLYDTDGDGMRNGTELTQASDPAVSDSSAAALYGYSVSVAADEGDAGTLTLVVVPNPVFPYPGVQIDTVGGSTAGTIILALEPGPPITLAVTDLNTNRTGKAVSVSTSGTYTLTSPAGLVVSITVNANSLAQAATASNAVPVNLTTSLRNCFHINIQNITLAATQAATKRVQGAGTQPGTGPGWNVVNVYMAEALNGATSAPTIYRADTIPFQFTPPNTKTPSGPFITLHQNDLSTLTAN
jgi:hypothetical protein